MPRHSETRFLPYTPKQLYDLVIDIGRYPEFIPWCIAARIVERGENWLKADLVAGYKVFRETFTSNVIMTPYEKIEVDYVQGPLAQLTNCWRFTPAKGGCNLSFDLEFGFRNALFTGLFEMFFEKALKHMSDAFEARARALYAPLPAIHGKN